MKTWIAGLLVASVLAGCVGSETTPELPQDWCEATPYEQADIRILNTTDDPIDDNREEHQWDHSTYNVRTCSLRAVGHSPLRWNADGSPAPHGYIGEIDTLAAHDLAAVAVLGAGGETPTVYLLDIADRADPQVLAAIEQVGTYLTDVKLSPDGAYLVTASQGSINAGELAELPELTANGGFTVYDIRDPSDPQYLFTEPDLQGGCHMLEVEWISDTFVVACISQQVRIWGFVPAPQAPTQFLPLGFVDYLPIENGVPTPSADPTCGLPTGCVLGATSGPHDMTISRDPDGRVWMTVSHWNSGMRLVDLTDAPQATEIGVWKGEGATHYDGNVHTAMTFWADGHRYTMASPEYTYAGQVPSLWLLDTDDPAAPTLVGQWYHPNEHTSQGLYLTTHQWQVAPTGPDVALEDVHVYLTYNHAGVWVLGLKEILDGDLWGAIKGFHLGRTPIAEEDAVTGNAVLNTWDVNVVDGYIYGTDRMTGLWVFDYDGDDHLAGVTGFA